MIGLPIAVKIIVDEYAQKGVIRRTFCLTDTVWQYSDDPDRPLTGTFQVTYWPTSAPKSDPCDTIGTQDPLELLEKLREVLDAMPIPASNDMVNEFAMSS